MGTKRRKKKRRNIKGSGTKWNIDFGVGVGKEAVKDALGIESPNEFSDTIVAEFIIPNGGYPKIMIGGFDPQEKDKSIYEYLGVEESKAKKIVVTKEMMKESTCKKIVNKKFLMSLIDDHTELSELITGIQNIVKAEFIHLDKDKTVAIFIIKVNCNWVKDDDEDGSYYNADLNFIIPNNGFAKIVMGGINKEIKREVIKEYFGEYDVKGSIIDEALMTNINIRKIVDTKYLMSIVKNHGTLKHCVSAVKIIQLAEMFIVEEDKNMCMFIIRASCEMIKE